MTAAAIQWVLLVAHDHLVWLGELVGRVVAHISQLMGLQLLALQVDACRRRRLIRALARLTCPVAICPLDELHLLFAFRCFQFLACELGALLVRRKCDLVLKEFPLIVFELVGFGTLAWTVVDIVGVELLWRSKQIGGRNVEVLLKMLLLGGSCALRGISQLVQVPPRLRGAHSLVEVGLELLVPVEVLYHQIQVVLVFLERFGRLRRLVRILYHVPVATPVSISVSIPQSWYALRIFNGVVPVPVVQLTFMLIELALDAQDLPASNIQRLFVHILVLFVLSVGRLAIVGQRNVRQVPKFVFSVSVIAVNILRSALPNIVRPLVSIVAVWCKLLLDEYAASVDLVIFLT